MVAGLTTTRAELAVRLGGLGYAVSDHVPNRILPPAVIISTQDPYVTEGETFREQEMQVHLSLFLVAGTAQNDAATRALDQMIEAAISVLTGWTVSVSAPYMATVAGSQFLTARLDLDTEFLINP